MQYTQKELARRFATGAKSGTASNMSIQTDDVGRACLVGYGWALYARRDGNDIVVYEDAWREWATERGGNATHGQLTAAKRGIREALGGVDPAEHSLVTMADSRPTVAPEPASVAEVGGMR